MRRCSALILAAGGSARMGRPKQLLVIDGETLVERAVRVAHSVDFEDVVVVLGAHADEITPLLAGRGVRIILNEEWKEGMGSSVRRGVESLSEAEGVMILLVDQIMVTAERLTELLERFRTGDADVVTASNQGITSPPAAFARSMFPGLTALSGESGAKRLLASARVEEVEFPEAIIDLDTPRDYEAAKSRSV